MEMISVKVTDLDGAALDYAVAMSEKVEVVISRYPSSGIMACWLKDKPKQQYSPSKRWRQGGRLLAELMKTGKWEIVQGKNSDVLVQNYNSDCMPVDGDSWDQQNMVFMSADILVAVCRAVVGNAIGQSITIPAELLQGGEA